MKNRQDTRCHTSCLLWHDITINQAKYKYHISMCYVRIDILVAKTSSFTSYRMMVPITNVPNCQHYSFPAWIKFCMNEFKTNWISFLNNHKNVVQAKQCTYTRTSVFLLLKNLNIGYTICRPVIKHFIKPFLSYRTVGSLF